MEKVQVQIAAFLASLIAISVSAKANEESTAAVPDRGWVASFYWSPQYCHEHRTSHEEQCAKPHGLVLNSFARIEKKRIASDCGAPINLSQNIVLQLMPVMHNRPQLLINWDRFGGCSGVSDTEYASYVEFADRYIEWPAALSTDSTAEPVRLVDIATAITQSNPSLPAEAMNFQCNRGWLQRIDVCMNQQLRYDGNNCQIRSSCEENIRIRPFQMPSSK